MSTRRQFSSTMKLIRGLVTIFKICRHPDPEFGLQLVVEVLVGVLICIH